MSVRFGPIWVGGAFVVGIADDEETGCLRMYLGHRYKGIYALVEDEEAKRVLRREWANSFAGHLMVDAPPPSCLYTEAERP